MDLPDRVFVLARVPPGGPSDEHMLLFSIPGPRGSRLTPVFSSMAVAATFLAGAQALGHRVPLDYVFPLPGARFMEELGEYTPRLDPAAEDFFLTSPERSA